MRPLAQNQTAWVHAALPSLQGSPITLPVRRQCMVPMDSRGAGRKTLACRAANSDEATSSAVPVAVEAMPTQPMLTLVASVDVGDAVEQLTVPVRSPSSVLMSATLSLPMGLVLEESQSDGCFVVVEVTPGGSAAAKNVREGDVVRGVTAASMQMTYPTLNLMFGGGGRPKLKRIAVPVAGRPFSWLREAIKSNSQLPGNSITLVLERLGSDRPSGQPGASLSQQESKHDGVFDPSIFD